MPGTPTPTLGLAVPTVGADVNTWGAILNSDLSLIDLLLGSADIRVINSNTILNLVRPLTLLLVSSGAAGVQITMPSPVPGYSRIVLIKKIDQGVGLITLIPATGLIEGGANYIIGNYLQTAILAPDAANWWAFAET